MPDVAQKSPAVAPVLIAALLLAAREHSHRLSLPCPGADDIFAATGAGRSQAYAYRQALLERLPSLQRPPGRPPVEAEVPPAVSEAISREEVRFLMAHPGCVSGGPERRFYGKVFRSFVLELRREYHAVPLAAFARAVDVPLGTLEGWLSDDGVEDEPEPAALKPPVSEPEPAATVPQVESVLTAWGLWAGTFSDFCAHVQVNLRIRWSRAFIADLLKLNGLRTPGRRPGRLPDEKALRGQFQRMFPDAQWVGDGMQVTLLINGERFNFNVELLVDASSAALVGAAVSDEEDSAAVIDAFNDGLETTEGTPPIAVLLDNKPANLTDEVRDAIAPTLRIQATLGRPQTKGHVEGAFGLFQQAAPPLEINASTSRELAQQCLTLVLKMWGRTLNHRPRSSHKGKTRFQLHQEAQPTEEDIERARTALLERKKTQEKAAQTRAARQDPLVRALLDEAFARLDLPDPDGNIRASIAGYTRDAVVAGVATFEGKRAAGSLPPGVDGRYLLGIVRNIAEQDEGMKIADAQMCARLAARDRALAGLEAALAAITGSTMPFEKQLDAVSDQATSSERLIDRHFWLDAASRMISAAPPPERQGHLREAARRIHAAYGLPYRDRLAAVRMVAAKVLPLE